jgi:hypothetical protein
MKKNSGKDRMDKYPPHLRGPAQNGHGGYQMQRERGLRGGTYGAANEGRSVSDEERRAWAADHGHTTH